MIRFIKDTIYDIYQYLLMIVIVLVVTSVLFTTIKKLYTTDYNQLDKRQPDKISITNAVENEEPNAFELIFPDSFNLLDTCKVLVDSKVITNEEEFVSYIQENNYEDIINPGTFHFTRNMSYEEVVETFQNAIELDDSEQLEDTSVEHGKD